MAKLLPTLAVLALSVNLFATLLVSSGAAATMGINPAVGGDDKVDEAKSEAGDIQSGAPTGSTLFGMYNVVSDAVSAIAAPVVALPDMLSRLGAPSVLTNMMKTVLGVVYGLGIISLLRGYSLND